MTIDTGGYFKADFTEDWRPLYEGEYRSEMSGRLDRVGMVGVKTVISVPGSPIENPRVLYVGDRVITPDIYEDKQTRHLTGCGVFFRGRWNFMRTDKDVDLGAFDIFVGRRLDALAEYLKSLRRGNVRTIPILYVSPGVSNAIGGGFVLGLEDIDEGSLHEPSPEITGKASAVTSLMNQMSSKAASAV
jgi:hypothetical protein